MLPSSRRLAAPDVILLLASKLNSRLQRSLPQSAKLSQDTALLSSPETKARQSQARETKKRPSSLVQSISKQRTQKTIPAILKEKMMQHSVMYPPQRCCAETRIKRYEDSKIRTSSHLNPNRSLPRDSSRQPSHSISKPSPAKASRSTARIHIRHTLKNASSRLLKCMKNKQAKAPSKHAPVTCRLRQVPMRLQ